MVNRIFNFKIRYNCIFRNVKSSIFFYCDKPLEIVGIESSLSFISTLCALI